MDGQNVTVPTSEPVAQPPIIGSPGAPARPKPFSTAMTIVFACLAIAVCLFRNWPYLTANRIALFSDPQSIALWIIHDAMLFHEGAEHVSVVKTASSFSLLLGGASLESIPKDCEKVLRDTIAYLESTGTNRVVVRELLANLAVLLAETGSLQEGGKVLVQLDDSKEANRFIRAFYRVYKTGPATVFLPGDGDAADMLVSGWGRWRFTERLSKATGDPANTDWYEESIQNEGTARIARWILWSVVAGTLQIAGLASLVAFFVLRRQLKTQALATNPSWKAGEGWGLFVRAMFWGMVAEYVLVHLPIFGYLAWLSHCLVLGFPAIVLLWVRHWRHGNASFRNFFGLPNQPGQLGQLLFATLATFALGWLVLACIPYGFELVGIESDWAEAVDEVLLVWPWYGQFVHLLDAILWGPCAEEILFRGLLFGALRARFSAWPSALLSALPFGLYHFYGLPGFAAVTAFGVICAIAREKTGSLLPCIAAHMLTNFLIFAGEVFVRF